MVYHLTRETALPTKPELRVGTLAPSAVVTPALLLCLRPPLGRERRGGWKLHLLFLLVVCLQRTPASSARWVLTFVKGAKRRLSTALGTGPSMRSASYCIVAISTLMNLYL